MKAVRWKRAGELLARVEPMLVQEEVKHNLPLGILRQLSMEEERGIFSDAVLVSIEEDHVTQGLLLQTPPRNAIVCGSAASMEAASGWLASHTGSVPGVVGCEPAVHAFVRAWTAETGEGAELKKRQIIYRLDDVRYVDTPPGKLTFANEDDAALVMFWTEKFAMGSLRKEDVQELEATVLREIRNNQVFLWRDDTYTPKSMAKRARDLTNGVVMNYVYTPKQHEKQGYATACVKALAERLINEGFRFCSVNTDDDHLPSKFLYEKLGFEPAGISYEFAFTAEGMEPDPAERKSDGGVDGFSS
ncbi:GNAT family N-acetyltransferase [Alkalicoccus chagannorensis]|uniref:GNAT family N-acetyltransferase n=1 Tax=Alkalicoccus chagannorensis TaxID=427072 RepID=UPI0004160AC8|nr:GNAT family N-acetyltransferase [Alkalicoccus chagannorensis]